MKVTLSRFLLIVFLMLSVIPLAGLGYLHIKFLDQILNSNQSFLKLIEHEEFNLFTIYLCIVFVLIAITILLFRKYVTAPINLIAQSLSQALDSQKTSYLKEESFVFFELKQFARKFNNMLESLEHAKTQQKDFVATLTHDLKTPLIAEKKAFEILTRQQLSQDELIKIANSLSKNNSDLLKLIESLLLVFKLESNQLFLNKEKISLSNLVDDSFENLYPIARDKNITFINKITDNWFIVADALHFKRVIQNLLINAIENSPAKSTISFSTFQESSHVLIEILDDGFGIDPKILPSIFDKYSSGNSSKLVGGLGLYIAKLIVNKHDGWLDVEKDKVKGTKFIIKLPVYDN